MKHRGRTTTLLRHLPHAIPEIPPHVAAAAAAAAAARTAPGVPNTGWFPRNPAARSEVNIPALSATLSALSLASLSASWGYRVVDVD
eukprot:CAMPEP_0198696228 /NCGR_PEP_ID=MMETSP1468-20131203/302194_1 /TAXON_ID=1461545 /ORGANISM="Mantoniella sp, Strain CCMP1436" /LENGTH=86 /DNA_ID=CAMNT_0044452349 /DNA_START=38 /DNA_END=299 /DNA_ORIENTATION=+